jgi:hypothetical protein
MTATTLTRYYDHEYWHDDPSTGLCFVAIFQIPYGVSAVSRSVDFGRPLCKELDPDLGVPVALATQVFREKLDDGGELAARIERAILGKEGVVV